MARRENCVHCLLATAANQPTVADYCRQCGRSTDLEGVATVDGNVLVSAVTDTLYERCNSQIPQGGRRAATGTFKIVSIDLVSAHCDAKPWLWRKTTVISTASRRRVKYVINRMEGIASLVCFLDKHGDPPRVRKMKSRTRAERAQARVEQHKRRGSFSWARLTDNGDIVTLRPPFIVEVTETMWKRGSKLSSIVGTLRFQTAIVLATPDSDVQFPEGYPVIMDSRSAWPTLYADSKTYIMRELQHLCGTNFLLGVTGESDARRSVHGWDCTAPNPATPNMMVGGSRLKWESLDGEDEAAHMGRDKQGRHELGHENT
jgi:hypothetical protein